MTSSLGYLEKQVNLRLKESRLVFDDISFWAMVDYQVICYRYNMEQNSRILPALSQLSLFEILKLKTRL